ncbi:MAG: hypothetical protein ABIB79_05250 [archaeon]
MKKMFILILSIFLISLISSQGVSYCCEKTTSGAWCQNEEESDCEASYRKAPTSCEATSYCKKGCCYNSQEGTCMENSPQKNCEDQGGVWESTADCDVPQCQLGCCLIGDQASFVTLTRCKRLALLYSLEINFRTDMSSEMMCIASATSETKGACVFEKEFEKTCSFLTQRECKEIPDSTFHKDFLCSAETLGADCGQTKETTCVEGKDEVYFIDSCGNIANIYDASKAEDDEYWSKIYRKDESCGAENRNGNANSASCGNCDYFLGSTCKSYKRTETTRPSYGDYICKDLSCEYLGKSYSHGETWCADAAGIEDSLPGSRHFRLVCYNGEVTVEPCADYRQEICIQSDIDGFRTAACRVNQWQDCNAQDEEKDCKNTDRRDCKWIGGSETIKCVPNFPPGFDFWEAEGDAESLCSSSSATCVVTCEEGLIGGEDCDDPKGCLSGRWKDDLNEMCIGIGDCIGKDYSTTNYIGIPGFNAEDD